jgi:hypothetical protein
MAGDALVTLALAGSLFFDISPHAARGRVALSLILTMAPFAVVAPFLGPIIDRAKGGKRLMVLVSAGGRAVACLFMARYVHSLLLFPAAFATLVCSKGYVVAKAALVPGAVERPDDLIEANAKLAIGGAMVGFLAAIPGVAMLKLLSAATLLRVDSVVFILCGLSALRILPRRPSPVPQVGTMAAAATTQARAPAHEPLPPGVVQLAAVAVGSLRFSVGFMTFLVAFSFRRSHAAAWWYGLVLAASVAGNLIGAVIAPRLRGRVREEHILAGAVVSVALAGLVVMQFAVLNRYPAAALMAAMVGVGAGAAKLAFDSLVQREVPAAAQGRAFARFEAVFQLVWVVGGLVPVVIAMSLRAGFTVVTTVTAGAVAAYQIGGWLGRQGRLPTWWPGTARGTRRQVGAGDAAGNAAGAAGAAGAAAGGGAGGHLTPWPARWPSVGGPVGGAEGSPDGHSGPVGPTGPTGWPPAGAGGPGGPAGWPPPGPAGLRGPTS